MDQPSQVFEDSRAGSALHLSWFWVVKLTIIISFGGLFCHPQASKLSSSFLGARGQILDFTLRICRVFRSWEALFLEHLLFYLSSLLCYLGPGDRLLNLFLLALHSIDPYLLRGWGLAFPSPSSSQMDLCPLQVIRLPLDLGKACEGMQIQKEIQHPPLGATRLSTHASPACVLFHFPSRSPLLGHHLCSPVPGLPPPPPGGVDRGKGYFEFSPKNCPVLFHSLSSVNPSGLVEPKTNRIVTLVTQRNCRTFSVFKPLTSKIRGKKSQGQVSQVGPLAPSPLVPCGC